LPPSRRNALSSSPCLFRKQGFCRLRGCAICKTIGIQSVQPANPVLQGDDGRKKPIAEAFGTAVLVLVGCGAVVAVNLLGSGLSPAVPMGAYVHTQGMIAIALAFGLFVPGGNSVHG
jgi:hypothetical protein